MEALGRLAGGVAHDFNNLLTVIAGCTELLLEAMPPADPARELVDQIRNAGQRAVALTRQLLTFSRRQIQELEVVDLNTVVEEAQKLLGRVIGDGTALATNLEPHLGKVKADPGQLVQVITNLVVNAVDAMPQGGRLVIQTANVELDEAYAQAHPEAPAGRYVMLGVADTGVGMEAAVQARIFEPFFTTKDPGKGTGLGLSIVFGIVEQCGGHIGVTSEPGRGTTVRIHLPEVAE
jgi:signal transduction histidine kinase